MGVPVLILGESGSGKSASLRNFSPEEVVIYNVAGKPLPFRNGVKLHRADNVGYQAIKANLAKKKFKCYVIDDSQYLLSFELFDRTMEKGYDKFTDIAVHFYSLLRFVVNELPPDCIVYFLHHIQYNEVGKIKAKTVGKMLDEKLSVDGLFSIVLLTENDEGKHIFLTASDGNSTVKTPMEMFDKEEIDNDLKAVDAAIRNYYEFGGITQ